MSATTSRRRANHHGGRAFTISSPDRKLEESALNYLDALNCGLEVAFLVLLRESVPHSDGNFSAAALVNVLNNELANTLGNLLNRCTGKVVNEAQVYPGRPGDDDGEFCARCSPLAKSVLLSLESLADKVSALLI